MTDNDLNDAQPPNTREQVTATREQVGRMRNLPELTAKQQDDVDTAYGLLVDLEDRLVQRDLKDNLGQMRETAARLSEVAASLRGSISGLERVSSVVGAAAKALGALAETLTKAASAGIL